MLEEQVPEQSNDVAVPRSKSQSGAPVFSRPMPGRGTVRVELLVDDTSDISSERLRGRVVLDDAALTDVVAGATVIVEELEGENAEELVPELLRIARDNAAIARRVIRRRGTLARAD